MLYHKSVVQQSWIEEKRDYMMKGTHFNIISWVCVNEWRIVIHIYSFSDAAKKAIDGEFDIAEVLPRLIRIIYIVIDYFL